MKNEEIRKTILYYENSKQPMQILSYKKNFLHNLQEPAMVVFRKDGSIYYKFYFVEGYSITEEEFNKLHFLFKNYLFQDINDLIKEADEFKLRIIFRFAQFYDDKRVLNEITKRLVIEKLSK